MIVSKDRMYRFLNFVFWCFGSNVMIVWVSIFFVDYFMHVLYQMFPLLCTKVLVGLPASPIRTLTTDVQNYSRRKELYCLFLIIYKLKVEDFFWLGQSTVQYNINRTSGNLRRSEKKIQGFTRGFFWTEPQYWSSVYVY